MGFEGVRSADWKRILELQRAMADARDVDMAARCLALHITQVVDNEYPGLNLFTLQPDGGLLMDRWYSTPSLASALDDYLEPINAYMEEHPVLVHASMEATLMRPLSMSDCCSQRQLYRTGLYREAYCHLAGNYQVIFTLGHFDGHLQVLSINRSARDFSAGERQTLHLCCLAAREALSLLDQRQSLRSRILQIQQQLGLPFGDEVLNGLSLTDLNLLAVLAEGGSLRQIAARQGVGYGTLRNRCAALYEKVGLESRAQLMASLRPQNT